MIHEPKKLTEAIDIVLSEVKKNRLSDVQEPTWSISWTQCPSRNINNFTYRWNLL